ncbi:MAG: hypothetical protein M1530_01025 [Candidatus Marsarchaeota archaeon]|nr:hypothetical protein [Candidatus Marsarchaeota archaeon]
MAGEREGGKTESGKGGAGKDPPASSPSSPQPPPTLSVPLAGSMQEGLTMGEMVVRLDTYDDIFSDFDPRPHASRELSDDLLKELGRRYRENPKGDLEVRFYIPAAVREPRFEGVIRKRLKEHFGQERQKTRGQIREQRRKGLNYAAAGFALLSGDLLLTLWEPDMILVKVAALVLTPAGWFSLWTGLEKLVEVPYALAQQHGFYDRFAKCNYIFMTEERE